MKTINLEFTRKTVDLPDGITLGTWRAGLENADGTPALDASGVAIPSQESDGSVPFVFAGMPTGDYVGTLQRLDSLGAPFGALVKSDPKRVDQPQGEVPATVTITVA
jgi:hypothetical protein